MNTNFKVIGLTRLGIKPESKALEAQAPSTRPLELCLVKRAVLETLYLAIKQLLPGVTFDEVVSRPFQHPHTIVHLPHMFVRITVLDQPPGQDSSGKSHGKIKLDVITAVEISTAETKVNFHVFKMTGPLA